MKKFKNLRFYNSLVELYKNESSPNLKEKFWEYAINSETDAIIFRDWFRDEQKFYKLDNDIFVTTDTTENLSNLLKELEISLEEIGKSILDYDTAEEIEAAINYELEE